MRTFASYTDRMSTSFEVIDGDQGETLTAAVARRLRGQLAERKISGLRLAEITGLGRSTINRRLSGETAMNTDELETIEHTTGISAEFLLTGRAPSYTPPSPDGGDESLLSGSNRRPSAYKVPGVASIICFPTPSQAADNDDDLAPAA